LRGDCAADRVLHTAEGDEKGIAGGAEFMAGVLGNGVAEDATMLLQYRVIPVCAQLRQSGRRVLDVAKEEGDGAGGFGGHGTMSSAASCSVASGESRAVGIRGSRHPTRRNYCTQASYFAACCDSDGKYAFHAHQ
jgi:hypothetical protein